MADSSAPPAASTPAPDAAQEAAAPPSNPRVFVGNLPYATTTDELKGVFAGCAGLVDVSLVTHGDRALGYGFAEFASLPQAQDAVNAKHQSVELGGRTLNIELAQARDGSKSKRADGTRKRRNRRREGGEGGAGEGPPRHEMQHGLFVANLPFSLKEDAFAALFAEYAPISAHVVVNSRTKRSKGYGFVDFASPEQQEKALAAVDKKEVEGRELAVKIALPQPPSAEAKE